MRKADRHNPTKTLLMSAFSLAFCILCLLAFRGSLSVASAFIIPAVIVAFSRNCGISYYVLTYTGLMVVTFIFSQTQMFFVMAYLLLSFALKGLLVTPDLEIRFKLVNIIIYILLTTAVLYTGIRITQWYFLVPLHRMMLILSGYNDLRYFVILLLEATLVFVLNAIILKALFPKIRAALR